MKELIIKVDNDAVHLSPELVIPIEQTNIPIEYCKFRTYEEIYWKVELIEYNSNNKCWKVNVIDYFPKELEYYKNQISIIEVERIAFEKFVWENLEHLSSYKQVKLLDVLQNQDVERFYREKSKEKAQLSVV